MPSSAIDPHRNPLDSQDSRSGCPLAGRSVQSLALEDDGWLGLPVPGIGGNTVLAQLRLLDLRRWRLRELRHDTHIPRNHEVRKTVLQEARELQRIDGLPR